MLVILRSRVLRVLCCLISITKKVSFEIEYFVGTHSRKLRVILRTRVPRVVCDLIIVTKMSAVRSRISWKLIQATWDTSITRTTGFMLPHQKCNITKWRNVSCEIEDFVETHLCKLRGMLRSRVLRVLCNFIKNVSPYWGGQNLTAVELSECIICGYGYVCDLSGGRNLYEGE